jgi:O-antigen ligase
MRELPWPRLAAALPLTVVGAIFTWWGWKSGAYFGVVFLPGTIVLLALLVILLLFGPWPARLAAPVRVALLALLALAVWTGLSALWSPAPDTAIADTQRVVGYATLFVLGLWLTLLLGRRLNLALLPLVLAAALLSLATLIALWTGDSAADFFETDATLRYPIGYRNAEAAFLLIALWPTVVLAVRRELDWRLRAGLTGAATLMIELAVLAQSRASPFAAAAAAMVLVLAHPLRFRTLLWLCAAAVPAALALPWLLDVYEHGGENTAASIPPLHSACRAMALTTVLAVAGGALVARQGLDLRVGESGRRLLARGLIGFVAATLAIGGAVLVVRAGGPGDVLDKAGDELTAGTPDLNSQGSRFGVDFRTSRGGFWRTALDDAQGRPLSGEGAGGFRHSYLTDRDDGGPQPEDPHSVELLMASELGLPGLLLFVAFASGATVAVMRARRLGPAAGALAAGALAASAYWLVHASVDWFWSYPAVTAPVIFALGAAAAPICLRPEPAPLRRPVRLGLAAAAGLAALSVVPFFLSERYTNHAIRNSDADAQAAFADLDRAADLDPLSSTPLIAEAVIAERLGDRPRALDAVAGAERRNPDDWQAYFVEARVASADDPARARVASGRALQLNPQDPGVQQQAEQLGLAP